MASCTKCNADVPAGANFCPACGMHLSGAGGHHLQHAVSSIFAHIPHPHIHLRRQSAAKSAQQHQPEPRHLLARFNAWFAVKVTDAVGTMWCAYAFAALALVSLPDALKGGTATLVAWIAQTFIQLVLLSIIIVGQKVASEASDKRAIDTFNDAEALLHEAVQVQQHLAAQDAFLQRLIDELCEKKRADQQALNAASGGPSGGGAEKPA